MSMTPPVRVAGGVAVWSGKEKYGCPSNSPASGVTVLSSIIQFTPAMRAAVAALLALSVAGLGWRAYTLYQADQRALKAAAFLAELESGSGASLQSAADGSPEGGPPAQGMEQPARTLIVHVDGAVQKPDVYALPEGARVNDAILAAGGPLPDAVPGVLNLAAPLVDGAKVYVYRRSELEPQAAPPPKAQGATYQPVTTTLEESGDSGTPLVNINTAGQAELETVPGIGPAIARKIIDYRNAHGPFQTVDDLINVSGIGPKTLEKMRPYLTR